MNEVGPSECGIHAGLGHTLSALRISIGTGACSVGASLSVTGCSGRVAGFREHIGRAVRTLDWEAGRCLCIQLPSDAAHRLRHRHVMFLAPPACSDVRIALQPKLFHFPMDHETGAVFTVHTRHFATPQSLIEPWGLPRGASYRVDYGFSSPRSAGALISFLEPRRVSFRNCHRHQTAHVYRLNARGCYVETFCRSSGVELLVFDRRRRQAICNRKIVQAFVVKSVTGQLKAAAKRKLWLLGMNRDNRR